MEAIQCVDCLQTNFVDLDRGDYDLDEILCEFCGNILFPEAIETTETTTNTEDLPF